MKRFIDILIALIFCICSNAHAENMLTPAQPSRMEKVVLQKRPDNKRPRKPAKEIPETITGIYLNGILFLDTPEPDQTWEITICSDSSIIYAGVVTTEDLSEGLSIPLFSVIEISIEGDLAGAYYGELIP